MALFPLLEKSEENLKSRRLMGNRAGLTGSWVWPHPSSGYSFKFPLLTWCSRPYKNHLAPLFWVHNPLIQTSCYSQVRSLPIHWAHPGSLVSNTFALSELLEDMLSAMLDLQFQVVELLQSSQHVMLSLATSVPSSSSSCKLPQRLMPDSTWHLPLSC